MSTITASIHSSTKRINVAESKFDPERFAAEIVSDVCLNILLNVNAMRTL